MIFRDEFCSSLFAFYARQSNKCVVILHEIAITQQKGETNAVLWTTVFVNIGRTLYSLLLNIHREQLCYTLSVAIKEPYFEQILILKDKQALSPFHKVIQWVYTQNT